jgi:uncharacterized protein YecE (DUF72 family)
MKKPAIYIGTSGWSYKHWKGNFYPADIKDSDEFAFFLKHFSTVEINSSFYHLPKAETFSNWRKKTPKNFLFSVKASRYITHMKKLKNDDDGLENFLEQAKNLKEKLGPILFQLPPGWKLNLERLEEFLSVLPKKYRYTFELRNHTWHDKKVYDLLKKYNCALCIYDLQHFFSPVKITSDFVYIRFHGPADKYAGNYTKAFLKKWAKKILQWKADGLDVFVYFDNDQSGYAAFNAQTLIEYTA